MELQLSTTAIKEINFRCSNIDAYYISNVTNHLIKGDSIVVNIGLADAVIDKQPVKVIAPMKSAILKNTVIRSADALVIITMKTTRNIGQVILDEQWQAAEKIFGEALRAVPLWRSPQTNLGEVEFSPGKVSSSSEGLPKQRFKMIVNLWYATADTHCVIHNKHDFIEFHTQILGNGRMQKFDTNEFSSLYEEVKLAEGSSHDLFCEATSNNQFLYPWHQYYSDTDCIWLVTEYHPV